MFRTFRRLFQLSRGTEGRQRHSRLRFEVLEFRDVPAILVWQGSGDWSNPDNWGAHRIPEAGDTLWFENGDANSVDDIALTVDTIQVSNDFTGTITIGADLSVTNSFTAYGTVAVEPDVTLDAGSIFLYGEMDVTGGTAVSISSSLLDMTTTGTLITASNLGTDGVTQLDVTTVDMGTGASWHATSSADLTGTMNSSGGTITIDASATVDVGGDFTSSGTLDLDADSTLSVASTLPVALSGTTSLKQGVTIAATAVDLDAGGEMNLSRDPFSAEDINITGDLNVKAGTLRFENLGINLNVRGNYNQTIGTLEMQFSFQFGMQIADAVIVSGSTNLGGNLEVIAANEPPDPFPGASNTLIASTGGVSGDFTSVEVPPAPVGSTESHGWVLGSGFTGYVLQYSVP